MNDERIREIFWKVTDRRGDLIDFARELLSASIADTAGAKPVATVRVTHDGHGMELRTYVACALPDGKHNLFAAPPAPSVADDAEFISCLIHQARQRWQGNWTYTPEQVVEKTRELAANAPSVADAAGASEVSRDAELGAFVRRTFAMLSDSPKSFLANIERAIADQDAEIAKESGND